jgi:hypothetical protein
VKQGSQNRELRRIQQPRCTSVAGGTTAWTQEIEQRMEQLPRTPGATGGNAIGLQEQSLPGSCEPKFRLELKSYIDP